MGHFPINLNRWPLGRVPFTIAKIISGTSRTNLEQAIEEWNNAALGVELVAKEPTDFNSVHFTAKFYAGSPCDSTNIGMQGGKQLIRCHLSSLMSGVGVGTWTHEIGHAVGLKHEHQRWDRDDFVVVQLGVAALAGKSLGNFKKLMPYAYDTVGGYDCHSLMHYGPMSFQGFKYFRAKPGGCADIGSHGSLTTTDKQTVKHLYA